MLKALSYWSFEHGLTNTHDIASALAEAKDAGFEAVELAIGTEGVLTTESTEDECKAIRELIDQSGIKVETLASGMSWGCNPTSEDPEERARAIDLHARALERASWLGLSGLLFVPGIVQSPICPDVSIRYDVAFARSQNACVQLLEVAEKVGVDLLIENVWNGLFYSPIELAVFVDAFKSDRLGIYFDAGNVLGYHQNPAHWIELLGSRIRRVHIKDFKKDVGTLAGFCDLLEGDVNFPETMTALRQLGYDKTVVAEMIPWNQGLVERTGQAMDQIFAMGEQFGD